ncbi:hypothetical protein D3227_29175 [Mesorhizobium waimense]|uniref:Uncharacterized protein n=1 Tax=Mesorhizobium waimense TaxID=1300307 RepID=A0A3A5K992_9HYPH|nr:hypothetical protein D3227_29175 [Mesorhizobium waimense]
MIRIGFDNHIRRPAVAVHGGQQLSLFNAHTWNGPLGKCIFQTADHAGTVRSYVRPFSAVI